GLSLPHPPASRAQTGRGRRPAPRMGTATVGGAQPAAAESLDEPAIGAGGRAVLPALTRVLGQQSLGTAAAPRGTLMNPRKPASALARNRGAAAADPTLVAASAAETPRRWARAARTRTGAAPRARRAARSPGRRPGS